MTGQEAIQRFQRLDASQREELAKLGARIADEAREGPRAVVQAWAEADDRAAPKPAEVALQLEDLVLAPMFDVAPTLGTRRQVQFITAAVETKLALRVQILDRLAPMLDDRTRPPGGDDRARRTCDEAYVLIRRLVRVDLEAEKGLHDEAAFVGLGAEERDKEIRAWKRS